MVSVGILLSPYFGASLVPHARPFYLAMHVINTMISGVHGGFVRSLDCDVKPHFPKYKCTWNVQTHQSCYTKYLKGHHLLRVILITI